MANLFRRGTWTLLLAAASGKAAAQGVVSTDQVSNTNALLIGVSPVSEKVVWVAGIRGTWLRTLDGGASWQAGRVPGADSLQFRDVQGVDERTAYLLSIGDGDQSRIYKTRDGGATWSLQFTNPEPKGFYDCMDFWDERRGMVIGDAVAGSIAILTTSDGGEHWARIPPDRLPPAQEGEGSFAASGTCLTVRPGGHAWIVMSNPERARVLHTADYGATWSFSWLPIQVRPAVGPTSVSFRDAEHGVVMGSQSGSQPGDTLQAMAALTSDGGKSWARVSNPPLPRGVWGGGFVPGTPAPTLIAVGPDGAAYSRDEGKTWMTIDALNYWSVAMASPWAGWAVGTRGRITKLSGFAP